MIDGFGGILQRVGEEGGKWERGLWCQEPEEMFPKERRVV